MSWLSIAIFGSLPFIFSNVYFSFTNAFFESMSGITTTGSTIISDLENMPKGILFWRAILQWLGGIGIIVMAITLMPIMNVGGMQLFKISSNDINGGSYRFYCRKFKRGSIRLPKENILKMMKKLKLTTRQPISHWKS